MATPILTIPVDDAAFKRFLDTFAKYQSQVKAQPEIWKDSADAIGVAVAAGAAFSAELSHQGEETRKLIADEAARDRALSEAARKRKKEAEEVRKAEKEAHERRKLMIDQTREFGRTLADRAQQVAKLGVGFAAGMLGGMWGLETLASSAATDRRTAVSMGTTMSKRQGLQIGMAPYYDADTVLGNVADTQNDPSKQAAYAMLGVNPNGDAADVGVNVMKALRRLYQQDHGNKALLEAQGAFQFAPYEQLRSNADGTDARYNQRSADALKLNGLSMANGTAWQDFMLKLNLAGAGIENTLIKKLSDLEPKLEDVVVQFGNLAVKVLDNVDWDALGKGIKSFGDEISSPEFLKSMNQFVGDIEYIAAHLPSWDTTKDVTIGAGAGAAAGFTIGAFGGPIGMAGGALLGGIGGYLANKIGNALGLGSKPDASVGTPLGAPAGGGAPLPAASAWAPTSSGGSLADRFAAMGASSVAAQGIAAGISAEGGSLGASANGAFGIGQWRGARKSALFAKYGQHPTLDQQIAFLWSELKGGDIGGPSVLAARSFDEALHAYVYNFMRPQGAHNEHAQDAVADIRRGRRVLANPQGNRSAANTIHVKNSTGQSVAVTGNMLST